jgi:hypothetical protein
MTQDFLEGLIRNGVTYEIRSNGPIEKDVMTLSNGQKVRLIDQAKVSWTLIVGKGEKVKYVPYSYTICRAEVIR